MLTFLVPLDEQDVAISTWIITSAPASCGFADSHDFLFGGRHHRRRPCLPRKHRHARIRSHVSVMGSV